MEKIKIILKRSGLILLSFAIALLIGFSSVNHPNTIVASAEVSNGWSPYTFDLGISAESTPSGYGDPYVATRSWYYSDGLYNYLTELDNSNLVNLNTGVISFDPIVPDFVSPPTYSDEIQVIFDSIYSMIVDAYSLGGEYNVGACVTLSSGMDNSISIYFVNTGIDVQNRIYVMDNSNLSSTILVDNGVPQVTNYILPYNNMYVSDIYFTRLNENFSYRDTIYNLRMNNINYDEFERALFNFFPLCQSYDFLFENGGNSGTVTPEFSEGFNDGFDSGYGKGYDKGYDTGYDVGYDVAYDYWQNQYNIAVENAFNNGRDVGLSEGFTEGERYGYDRGYLVGKDEGFNVAMQEYIETHGEFSWYGLFSAVLNVPVRVFTSLFDFEIFGINLAGFFVSIMSILVIVFILRKIL